MKPGISHFFIKDGESQSRVHLRIDPDGSGLLIVNAARVFHLNPTAVFMADMALRDSSITGNPIGPAPFPCYPRAQPMIMNIFIPAQGIDNIRWRLPDL